MVRFKHFYQLTESCISKIQYGHGSCIYSIPFRNCHFQQNVCAYIQICRSMNNFSFIHRPWYSMFQLMSAKLLLLSRSIHSVCLFHNNCSSFAHTLHNCTFPHCKSEVVLSSLYSMQLVYPFRAFIVYSYQKSWTLHIVTTQFERAWYL